MKPLHQPRYLNDGFGRDTYISANNGGFSTFYNPAMISKKIQYETPRYKFHQNLAVYHPINKYCLDGNGRDYYIYNDILEQHDRNDGFVKLPNILRGSMNSTSRPIKISGRISPSRFERKLLSRIFYGNSPGVKERHMSPKVKFAKKKERCETEVFNEDIKEENEENKEDSNIKSHRVLMGVQTEGNENEDRYGFSRRNLGRSVEIKKRVNPKAFHTSIEVRDDGEDNKAEDEIRGYFSRRRRFKPSEPREESPDEIADKAKIIFNYHSRYKNKLKLKDPWC